MASALALVPEKCALSHGSGVLGRGPRDSCRFWSPHVGKVCTVTQFRLGEGGGGGGYHGGGGGRRTENRDHMISVLHSVGQRNLQNVTSQQGLRVKAYLASFVTVTTTSSSSCQQTIRPGFGIPYNKAQTLKPCISHVIALNEEL